VASRILSRLASLIASLTALAAAAALATLPALAQQPELSISDATEELGGEVSVELSASGFSAPGLGAWTLDIIYDPAVVTAIDCDVGPVQVEVCNPEFAGDTVRLAGADADGIEGDFSLGRITFQCADREAETALTVSPLHIADATPGDLQPIDAALRHGSITCVEAEIAPAAPTPGPSFPHAGGGGLDENALPSLMGALIALGLAALGSAVMLRRASKP